MDEGGRLIQHAAGDEGDEEDGDELRAWRDRAARSGSSACKGSARICGVRQQQPIQDPVHAVLA